MKVEEEEGPVGVVFEGTDEQLNFSVHQGEMVVVTGKSGSGKTTLLLSALQETTH